MSRASDTAAERLQALIEAAETIAHEAREQLEELAAEREAMTRAAHEMLDALLALHQPDTRRTVPNDNAGPVG